MNGSSAFSNVLLSGAAGAAPKNSSPKIENSVETESFRQHFDDARDNSLAEQRSPENSVTSSQRVESRQENRDSEPAARSQTKAVGKTTKSVKADAKSERQETKKSDAKTDEASGQANPGPNQPVEPGDSPLKLLLAGGLGLKEADATTDKSDSASPIVNGDASLQTSNSINLINATAPQPNASATPTGAGEAQALLSGQAAVQITNALGTDAGQGQSAVAVGIDGDAAQSVAPLVSAESGQVNPTQTGAQSTVSTPMNTSSADALANTGAGLPADGDGAGPLFAKFANASKAEKSDAQSAPAINEQASPEKGGFDKLLQTVAKTMGADTSSGSSTPLQSPPAFDGSAADSNMTASGVDSLARGLESQSPAARNFVVQTNVPVSVGQPQWSQAVGEKVLWLAAQNISAAEIHLHPKDLGPMQVNVSVNQDQANVTFTSHHPVVREVLDQNLGRLRDMFNEQGLNLVNVDVSDKSFQRQQGDGKQQQGQGGKSGNSQDEPTVAAVSVIKQERLVDHYA